MKTVVKAVVLAVALAAAAVAALVITVPVSWIVPLGLFVAIGGWIPPLLWLVGTYRPEPGQTTILTVGPAQASPDHPVTTPSPYATLPR